MEETGPSDTRAIHGYGGNVMGEQGRQLSILQGPNLACLRYLQFAAKSGWRV